MELAFVVYLISILESFSNFLGLLCAICCAIIVIGSFMFFLFKIDNQSLKYPKKTLIFLIIIALLCGTAKALLPSEKQAYAIAAAYGAQQVYQSEEAKQIGNKVLLAITRKLDELGEKEKK